MRLHREGTVTILITTLLVGGLITGAYFGLAHTPYRWVVFVVAGLSLAVWVLVVNFFRNPERQIPVQDGTVLAPCDGKVVVIEEVVEPRWFKEPVRQISIFMSPLNVHVNRVPVSGKIVHAQHYKGKYLVAWHPKSSTDNEQSFLVIQNQHETIGFKQIAGALAKRIKFYVKPGDELTQGQEFGFIKFGSRMDVFVPLSYEICVELGQDSVGGLTLLAKRK